MNSHFEKHPDETIVDVFSTHWVKYIGPILLYLLLFTTGILLFYLAILNAHHSMWISHYTFISALLIGLLGHHWFFHRLMSEGTVDIIITNRRFIHFKDILWFQDDMNEVPFGTIRAVEAHKRGVIQNLFRYGSLSFDRGSAIGHDRIIPFVPHPQQKAREIMSILHMK
ncbi:hypothetical protein HYZ98_01720 [Candidatus Peregrinibacteria bacterium]|nr:hypothetical protein [Candidatus Peregrinibacteria bacterium]